MYSNLKLVNNQLQIIPVSVESSEENITLYDVVLFCITTIYVVKKLYQTIRCHLLNKILNYWLVILRSLELQVQEFPSCLLCVVDKFDDILIRFGL